jgi:hypothetical protein
MGFYRGPHIVTDGLVLALDAANTKSYPGTGTTWSDVSGNNNNGTLTNGPTFNSANGGSIVFDGTNDYAQIAHNTILNPTLNMTMAVWINITNFINSMAICGKGTQVNGSGGFDFRIDNSSSLNLVKYFIVDQTVTITPLQTNTWYNICAVQGSTSVIYYINGLQVGSFSNSVNYQTNTTTFKICLDRASIYTPSRIANFMFYNRAITASEILQNYNATKSRFNL